MGCSQNIQVWKIVPFSSLDVIAHLIIKTYFTYQWMDLMIFFSFVGENKEELASSNYYPFRTIQV